MASVLIATIDSMVYDTLSAEVQGEGHDVIWATDGKEACDLALTREPALVFLEEALAIFSGFEVADLLRGDPDVPAGLPIILLTDEAVEPHHFERSGFTAQFPKTHGYFEVREFLAAHIRVPLPVWQPDSP